MGKVLRCPLPCHPDSRLHEYSDHYSSSSSQPTSNSHSDSSSSNSSSLSSQPSLPCVPSLSTPDSQTPDHATRCLTTLNAHSSYIFALAVSANRLFTAASNGEIRVWDRQHNPYAVLEGRSAVKSIVVLNNRIFTAHHDHKIRVWKIEDNAKFKLVTTLPTVNDRCMKIFSAKNYVQIRRHKKCTWVHHVDAVSGLALSPDGLALYSVSWDRTLKVWRTRDFKCVESIQNAHDDAINAVVVSSAGLVFTGSADKSIKVWKRGGTHSLVGVLEKHKSAINALAMSEDGCVLYSGACDRSIIVWGCGGDGGWAVSGALRGHRKAILCLGVVRDLLCSGSADKTVRIWRRGTGNSYSCLAVLEGHKSPVKCLTAAPLEEEEGGSGNSYLVYSGGLDFEIKVWQIRVSSLKNQSDKLE